MYEALYEQNRSFLQALANRWRTACERDRAVSVEDLTQAGFFGLVKAAESFNPSAGKSWRSWAAWYIFREFEIALCLRDGQARQPHTSALALDAPAHVENADGASFGDLLADGSLPEIDAGALLSELQQQVREAVGALPDGEQRRAVQLVDLEGKTSEEAAEALGVTAAHVRNCRAKARNILRGDPRLCALSDKELDTCTRFHAHKGLAAFERDWTSVTEGAALWRIEQRTKGQSSPEAVISSR